MNDLKVFSGRAHPGLAKRICEYLALPLGQMTVSDFPDGETHCKIEQDVRGQDIFVIQPTCPPVNNHLMELLIMIESLKRASAERVTAVIPYFGYARQDRKDEGRVPITAKLVANILTRAGADRVLTLDLHAAQIQGFFDIPVDHLSAGPVLDDYFRRFNLPVEDLVVVSPDEGSIKRASAHAKALNAALAIIDKRRFGNRVEQANIIGSTLEGKTVFLFDDMISTANSISGAARLAKTHGAAKIYIATTHAVLCGNAVELLRQAAADAVIVTDTIPQPNDILPNVTILSVAPLLGEAIRRIHCHESVSHLFREILSWTGRLL